MWNDFFEMIHDVLEHISKTGDWVIPIRRGALQFGFASVPQEPSRISTEWVISILSLDSMNAPTSLFDPGQADLIRKIISTSNGLEIMSKVFFNICKHKTSYLCCKEHECMNISMISSIMLD